MTKYCNIVNNALEPIKSWFRMLDFSPPAEAEWYGTYYFLSSEAIAPKIVPRPSHQVWVTKCPPRYKRTLTKYDG